MKRFLVLLVFLTACSGSDWTSEQEQEWMTTCQNGPTACACMLESFKEDGYSYSDVAGSEGFNIGVEAGMECGFG